MNQSLASPLYGLNGGTYELVNKTSGYGRYPNSLPNQSPLTMANGNTYYLGGIYKPYRGNMGGNGNSGSGASGMYNDPFGTAMSGTKSGTLQPYVNRMTQNASNALYGGLLGYSPQSMVAGDAGGTPVNSTAPQFNIPSALSQYGNGLNFTGFGNRSWMGK